MQTLPMTVPEDITHLLEAHAGGDSEALNTLMPLVYSELRRIAHGRLRGERPDHTFSTTGLVHEAYLKLIDLDRLRWKSRAQFFAIASHAMRNVLVNYAVERRAQKRGGDRQRVAVHDIQLGTESRIEDLLALDEALRQLERLDERQARVVECRFFGGMSIEDTAHVLGISTATANRDWATARAWLSAELSAD